MFGKLPVERYLAQISSYCRAFVTSHAVRRARQLPVINNPTIAHAFQVSSVRQRASIVHRTGICQTHHQAHHHRNGSPVRRMGLRERRSAENGCHSSASPC